MSAPEAGFFSVSLGGRCQRSIDDRLRLRQDATQVVVSPKTLGVYLVDVFCAGRTRRKPSARGNHLHTADRCAVARSLGQDALDFFASQLSRPYLLRGEPLQPLFFLRGCRRLDTIVNRFAELARKLVVNFAGIAADARGDLRR